MAFEGIAANFELPVVGGLIRNFAYFLLKVNPICGSPVSDDLVGEVAQSVRENPELRERLTEGIYSPEDDTYAGLEQAYHLALQAAPIERKLKRAIKDKKLPKKSLSLLFDDALQAEVITQDEHDLLVQSQEASWSAIQVDDFSQQEFLRKKKKS